MRACLRRNMPGPYQIQAAINAVHSDAPTAADTDWGQILQLYDQLLAVTPTPVVALNRAVAVAEVDGPGAGAGSVDGLDLDSLPPFHTTRAELLVRLGRADEAGRRAYDRAIAAHGQRGRAPVPRRTPRRRRRARRPAHMNGRAQRWSAGNRRETANPRGNEARVHIADIEYSYDGLRLVGQLAVDDERDGRRPAILVSHEGNGLSDHSKR